MKSGLSISAQVPLKLHLMRISLQLEEADQEDTDSSGKSLIALK